MDMQALMEGVAVQTARAVEEQLDAQISSMDKMTEDDYDAIRARRHT